MHDRVSQPSVEGVAVTDLEGNLVYVSDSFVRTWGYDDPREMVGKPAADFWRFGNRWSRLTAALIDGRGWTGEVTARRQDGSLFNSVISAGALTQGEDEAARMVALVAGTLDGESVEGAEHHAMLSFVDGLLASVYVVAPDYYIRYANRYFYERYGEAEGKPCYEVLHKRRKPCEECPAIRAFNTGSPQVHECSDSPDGRTYEAYAYPFTDTDGSPLVLDLAIDVTERKLAERETKRRNEELTALMGIASGISESRSLDEMLNTTLTRLLEAVDANAGSIHLLDGNEEEGLLSLVSHRGLSEEAVERLRHAKLSAGMVSQAPGTWQLLEEAALSCTNGFDLEVATPGEPLAFARMPIRSRDKLLGVLTLFNVRPRQARLQGQRLLTAIGYQIGVGVENARLVREASEVKILQEVDRLRSELIANVSHELRTPLGLIRTMCTTLLREDVHWDRETEQELLREMDEEAQRLEQVVGSLLDVSRIEGGQLQLNKELVDVGELATRVMQEMKVQSTQHSLMARFPADQLIATVDCQRVEQVLSNLLSNAVKYSPGGGAVTIEGCRGQGEILIRMSDEGIGIPREDVERVFERFFRVDNEITRRVGGVGLGLAVCRGIVEAHGGRIWAESTLGAGSTFCFTLPADAPSRSVAELASECAQLASSDGA